MTYADFCYYENDWGSEVVPRKEFMKYAGRASRYMERVTFGRIKEFAGEEIFVDLKNCMCDLADAMYKRGTGEVRAEWNGDYKVEYTLSASGQSETNSEFMRICKMYLVDFMNVGRKYA